jgi:hypothetical protein
MKVTRATTPTIITLGALMIATLSAGVTYASTATKGVKACATSSGTLGLLSHGKCAHGEKKVTIGATGARGPRGLPGVKGKIGAAGPGAVESLVNTTSTTLTGGAAKTVDDVKIQAYCGIGEGAAVQIIPTHINRVDGVATWSSQGGATGSIDYDGAPGSGALAPGLNMIDYVQDGTGVEGTLNTAVGVQLPGNPTSDAEGQMWANLMITQGSAFPPLMLQFEINYTPTNCFASITAIPTS